MTAARATAFALVLALLSMVGVGTGTAQAAAPLAQLGESVAGATVIDLIDHPEFHRIVVRLPDAQELTVEVVATDAEQGACTHHGFAVQPRWELLGVSNMEVEDQPPVVAELCRRLEAAPPDLTIAPPRATSVPSVDEAPPEPGAPPPEHAQGAPVRTAPDGPAAPHFRPLHGVLEALVLALLAGALGCRPGWPSRRELVELAGVTTLGAVLRAALGLWAPLWAPLFGFGRFAAVLGGHDSVSRYGDGYVSTMTAFTAAFGATTDTVLGANFLLGVAMPPLVWALTRAAAPQLPRAALVAGLLAAMLPVHVWITATEVMHVSLVTFELLAVWSALLFLRHTPTHRFGAAAFALAAGLATVMAVHTRPEAIPFVVVPAAAVLLHARRAHGPGVALAAVTIGGGLVFRFVEMAFDVTDEASALDYGLLAQPEVWAAVVVPDLSIEPDGTFNNVLLRPMLTSPAVPLLALAGGVLARRRTVAWLALWWLVALVPVLPKGWPLADAYRLQAPVLLPVVVLAGLGAARLFARIGALRPGSDARVPWVVGILAIGISPQLLLERPTWGTLDEARFFMAVAPTIPATATVLYDADHRHASSIAEWGALTVPRSRWQDLRDGLDGSEPTEPFMAWVGLSCTERGERDDAAPMPSPPCVELRHRCTLRPAATTTVALSGDIDRTFVGESAEVGLYYIDDCRARD